MKQLIFMLLALLALTACNKEQERPNIDPYAQLTINAPASKARPTAPYTMETVVRYAFEMMFWVDKESMPLRGSILTHDLVNLKFRIGQAESVVALDKNGNPKLGFLVSNNLRDLVVVASWGQKDPTSWVDAHWWYDRKGEGIPDKPAFTYDTIGYVPNKVIKAAEAEIHKAFYAGDYEQCMQLFETAYVFTPITGAEWRALKAKNAQ